LIQQAASTIPITSRDEHLRGVASHLGSRSTDEAVMAAIDAQLRINRLPVFLCDSTRGA
jgi:hypothetical protein